MNCIKSLLTVIFLVVNTIQDFINLKVIVKILLIAF